MTDYSLEKCLADAFFAAIGACSASELVKAARLLGSDATTRGHASLCVGVWIAETSGLAGLSVDRIASALLDATGGQASAAESRAP